MDRQLRNQRNYKLYTYYGNNSDIPARTQGRWLARKKIKSTDAVEENSEQRRDPPSIAPLAPEMNDNMENSDSDSSDGEKAEGHGSMENEDSVRNAVENEFSSEDTDESEDESVRPAGETTHTGTNTTGNILPPSLSRYSTEDLIPPLLALAIKLRHNLSYAATEDALRLAKVLTNERIIHSSKHDWKKISNRLCDYLSIHHFCHKCHSYIGKEVGESGIGQSVLMCQKCNEVTDQTANWKSGNVVLYLNLKDQIQYFLELNHEKLINPQNRKKQNKYALEDIFDGKMYKKIVSGDTITLNFNVDGTPVFKSSPTSIYPVLCTMNEIPPGERGKNMILCSLWFGEGKPKDMNELLKPFVIELQQLNDSGLDYMYQGEKYHKKCQALVGICDSVARPVVRNSTQFNGNYGCGLCLHPGVQVAKGKSTVRVFPIDDNGNPFGEGLRNHDDTLIHAMNGEKGMKGRSVMYDVPEFDVIDGLVADWMHLATLGVTKQFCKLWLDHKYHTEPFFLGRHESLINILLESFTPTLEISRTTRKIGHRKFWKAHEWSIWLLFYSLPILRDIAPRKYVEHWALLVDGISILLKTSIMRSEIEHARQCLYDFVKGVKELYGIEYVSFNVHLLTHLPDSVLNWGPLWTHSAFMYESCNFILKNCVHSSNGVPLQICDSFRYQISVIKLRNICEESLSHSQRNFLSNMLHRRILPKVSLQINDVGILGRIHQIASLSRPYYLALRRLGIHAENATTIELAVKILINDEIIHSEQYKRPKKRKSYIVLSKDLEVFEIKQFIILSYFNSQECYGIGHYYEKISSPFSRDHQLKHLTFVKNKNNDLAAMNVHQIKEKVTLIHLPKQEISIACIHSNKFESWK